MKRFNLVARRRTVPKPLGENLYREPKRRPPKSAHDNLFGWTVLLLLLIGAAFACWIGSFYIFQHPEHPRSYAILRKLKKLDPPKRFAPTEAPKGRFYNVEQALKTFGEMPEAALAKLNLDLLQAYLSNYPSKDFQVPYLTGRFNILDSHALGRRDFFSSGYVALARSVENPQLLLEQLYPADAEYQEDLARMLVTGVDVKLERTFDLSAVLHIERLVDGRLQFTVVPLNYDSYGLGEGQEVRLSPPPTLNLQASLPVIDGDRLDKSQESYSAFADASKPGAKSSEVHAMVARTGPAPDTEVMRVARALPVEGGTPPPIPKAVAAATPIPSASPKSTPAATSTPVLLAAATPLPTATPSATPTPTPLAARPVIVSGAAQTPAPLGRWQTYPAGRMPRGKLVDVPDLEKLTRSGVRETTYLQGSFVVTYSDAGQAVLRPTNRLASAVGLGKAAAGQTRVIVQYPAGASAPRTGSQVSRGGSRPFQIMQVQRGENGQVNVYVREVTAP